MKDMKVKRLQGVKSIFEHALQEKQHRQDMFISNVSSAMNNQIGLGVLENFRKKLLLDQVVRVNLS